MLAPLVLATVVAAPGSVVEGHGVRIAVELTSHVYTWTVTNVDAPPIRGLEIEQYHMYDAAAPGGWSIEIEDRQLRAWSDRPVNAIRAGQARSVDARVSSEGAVLGRVPVTVRFGPDHDPVVVDGVWGPVPIPGAMIVLVAACVAAIAGLHVLIVARR